MWLYEVIHDCVHLQWEYTVLVDSYMYVCTSLQYIEVKMKRLQRYPVSQTPPDPYSILYNHPWLSGLKDEVLNLLQECAELCERRQEDVLLQFGEPATGLFIIVSGLVKVCKYVSVCMYVRYTELASGH